MPSRSRSAKRSSTSAGALAPFLVAAALVAAGAGAAGLAIGSAALTGAALFGGLLFAGALAAMLIVSERRRHVVAEDELQAQASFLESLVESIAEVSGTIDPQEILQRACTEAKRLFRADSVEFREGESISEPRLRTGGMDVALAVRGRPVGVLAVERSEAFDRGDLVQATVLADFASRAFENARLVGEARERELERERLTDQLITAEQDERRRLSVWLHDGPLSTMSGIALMHDAALAAIGDGRYDDAAKVVATALDRERDTIRTLRDLSFALEPLVLRDQGFAAAVGAIGEQVGRGNRIAVDINAGAGERLAEKVQVELYQVIREAVSQAVRRRPKTLELSIAEHEDGAFELLIVDDGVEERRRASIEAIEERARVLNARVAVEQGEEGGTRIQVLLPAYVAAAG
jgi:signal transduction histidine kinase